MRAKRLARSQSLAGYSLMSRGVTRPLRRLTEAVVAYVVGMEPPASATADTPSSQKILRLANMAGDEIARRCDWRGMLAMQTIAGDGVKKTFSLNPDFGRLVPGGAVRALQAPFGIGRGGLASDAWRAVSFTATSVKFFRLVGGDIEFSAIVPNAVTIAVDYVSKNWVKTPVQLDPVSRSDLPRSG